MITTKPKVYACYEVKIYNPLPYTHTTKKCFKRGGGTGCESPESTLVDIDLLGRTHYIVIGMIKGSEINFTNKN